jgi:Ca-activated chloride channel family protein
MIPSLGRLHLRATRVTQLRSSRRRRNRVSWFIGRRSPLHLCLACFSAFGQLPEAPVGIASLAKTLYPPSIRVDSDLVLVPVTVLDQDDHSFISLRKEHFRVFDNKTEQVITQFAIEDAPVSIGFVFDASASMASKLRTSREAVARFLETANAADEFFLVQFNDRIELRVDLTKQTEEVQRQLGFVQAQGFTALLDAIYFSIGQMQNAHNLRRALVIVSDGGDNCSRYSVHELKNLIRESDVQIYAMGIFDAFDKGSRRPSLLREITQQSGGRMFEIKHLKDLPRVASEVGDALRSQYLLGYSPLKVRRDGKYHRVEVKLNQPTELPKLRASWRRGYYAPID